VTVKVEATPPTIKEFPITFRETGSAAALIDILFGNVLGADKDTAVTELVTTSVSDPVLGKADFNSLALQHRVALFGEILNHVRRGQPADFTNGSKAGPKPLTTDIAASTQETPDGGSGEPRKLSVSIRPKASATTSATLV
jgi:hypothetical protein